MLRLILLRHAKAVGPSADDHARPLAPSGRDDARAISVYLADEMLIPDLALVSDSVRTRETATLALAALDNVPQQFEASLYSGDSDTYLEFIRDAPDTIKTLMLVGHNPTCHELALALVGYGDRYAAQRMARDFPPGAFAVLDFDVESWAEVGLRKGRLDRFIAKLPI